MEIHTAEPSVLQPSPSEVETASAKLKSYNLSGTDQILVEMIQAGEKTLHSEHHEPLILLGIRTNCLSSGRSLLLYQFTRRVIKLSVVIIVGYHCYQLHTKFYPISFSQG
jgi:hypothetical protein